MPPLRSLLQPKRPSGSAHEETRLKSWMRPRPRFAVSSASLPVTARVQWVLWEKCHLGISNLTEKLPSWWSYTEESDYYAFSNDIIKRESIKLKIPSHSSKHFKKLTKIWAIRKTFQADLKIDSRDASKIKSQKFSAKVYMKQQITFFNIIVQATAAEYSMRKIFMRETIIIR